MKCDGVRSIHTPRLRAKVTGSLGRLSSVARPQDSVSDRLGDGRCGACQGSERHWLSIGDLRVAFKELPAFLRRKVMHDASLRVGDDVFRPPEPQPNGLVLTSRHEPCAVGTELD